MNSVITDWKDETKYIIVLLGKGGSGKDTVMNMIAKEYKNVQTVVSHTTRPVRKGEIEGKSYYFISDEKFCEMNKNKSFVETRHYNVITDGQNNQTQYPKIIKNVCSVLQRIKKKFFGSMQGDSVWYYGLAQEELENKLNKGHVIVVLDLQGYKELRKYYYDHEDLFKKTRLVSFYIDIDEEIRFKRYIQRDEITLANVKEGLRRMEADDRDFQGVEECVHQHIKFKDDANMDTSSEQIKNYIVKLLELEKEM